MSIPIKTDQLIFSQISGANIFADYIDVLHTPGNPGIDFQITPTNFLLADNSLNYGITFSNPSISPSLFVFNLIGLSGYLNLTNGQISGQNIYQGNYRVIDESQTGSFGGGGGGGVANIYEIRFFT